MHILRPALLLHWSGMPPCRQQLAWMHLCLFPPAPEGQTRDHSKKHLLLRYRHLSGLHGALQAH
eukprot:10976958-Karenia_brevis.AAC.1